MRDCSDLRHYMREKVLILLHRLLSHFLDVFRPVCCNLIRNMSFGGLEDEFVSQRV